MVNSNETTPIRLSGKVVTPHKALVNPIFDSKNVLTNSPWEYVDLWLRREKKSDALFYWKQAREFYEASSGLSTQALPLLLYYTFMNAAKALLSAKNISFNEYHGIQDGTASADSDKIQLAIVCVKIKNNGIVPSLAGYFGENEPSNIHSLKELLFNLPYIHRTYCLTYKGQTDMFIPITDGKFIQDKASRKAYFSGKLSRKFANKHVLNRLPSEFIHDTLASTNKELFIKSSTQATLQRPSRPSDSDLQNLKVLHKSLRKNLIYINGAQTLWYIRSQPAGPKILDRTSTTITLAAMHRLSELSRYHPLKLDRFLSSKENWLLSEFIKQSPIQFIDEIASEITGFQFLIPNVRPAT